MPGRLLAPLLGALTFLLLVINTLFWAIPVYACILGKLLSPQGSRMRRQLSQWMADHAKRWAHVNTRIGDVLLPTRWDLRIDANVDRHGQYLVCCNHQSWNDIYVVIKAMGKDAPFFKFFLKQELIWVPVLGLVWWGLDYPFMKRNSMARGKGRRGERRAGSDLDATRRACERFRHQPAVVLNFLEGTRFSTDKQRAQQSPYRHLLKPKSGGFAFALATLGDRLHSIIDVTIVYPRGGGGLWTFLSGRVPEVIVEVKQMPIPAELRDGNYEKDQEFRRRFQAWVGELWMAKDRRIGELLATAQAAGNAAPR